MNLLITPSEVVSLAFSGEELVRKEVITEFDILEAEECYVRPILGATLYEALIAKRYPTLLSDYVLPALAAWCRYVVHPHLDSRCYVCHESQSRSSSMNEHDRRLWLRLRRKASTLSRRLSEHLNGHCDDYPEYNPLNNPLNRCSIYGDIVQIF